ncbi:MAG: biotin--[acetyl-CoA-carboxylase] ligase, partial [Chloroflexi bacterium]|nr:biotin--[acetyl-CoA-carboxylase] ligase [Chloroflexota bacterium]
MDVFESKYDLKGKLKWPNDVLLNGAKVWGILTETLWSSDFAEAVVVGIG